MRDCSCWNKAALGKYIWKIAAKKDSLWVKWVHNIYLKNQEWWAYMLKRGVGWAWKKLCSIKTELQQGFESNNWVSRKYKIKDCYAWM